MANEEPKIIIDTDWKSQAQAEKERLAKVAEPAPGAAPAGVPGAGKGRARAAGFEDLIAMLAQQTLLYLGAYPDPETGQAIVSLEYARLHIDLLGILETKTKGNLTETEAATLTRMLHELRLEFVEVSKAVEKAVAQGKVTPMAPGGRAAPGIAGGPAPRPPGM